MDLATHWVPLSFFILSKMGFASQHMMLKRLFTFSYDIFSLRLEFPEAPTVETASFLELNDILYASSSVNWNLS